MNLEEFPDTKTGRKLVVEKLVQILRIEEPNGDFCFSAVGVGSSLEEMRIIAGAGTVDMDVHRMIERYAGHCGFEYGKHERFKNRKKLMTRRQKVRKSQ